MLILALAATLRLLWLADIPFRVDGDVARLAQDGIRVWENRAPVLGTGWAGHTHLAFYLFGFFTLVSGDEILGLRLFSALGGILGVAAIYLLARQHWGERVGLLNAFFLSLLPFHLVFSRNGLDLVWPVFFAALSLYLLPTHGFLAGVVVGLAQYFYYEANLIPILAGFYLLIRKASLRHILRVAAGFLLVFAPMLCYYLLYPADYMTRAIQVSIFQPGRSLDIADIGDRIVKSFLAFQLPVVGTRLWFVYTPYLDVIARVLFTVGLVVCIVRIRQRARQLILFWLVSGVFLGGVITQVTPVPSHYTILIPPVVILMGQGLDGLHRLTEKHLSRALRSALLLIITGLYTLTSLYAYWSHDTREIYRFDINTQIATFAGRYLRERQDEYHIYFLGTEAKDDGESMYYEAIPTLRFLTHRPGTDISEPVQDTMTFENNSVFIVLPHREAELAALIGLCPEGRVFRFRNPLGMPLFFIVENCSPQAKMETVE